jgi:hypothetical protein
VEAYGIDISEYAIQNVHPSIKPYCWVGSITEPFPQKYDLITCIEVLEHMPQQEAEKAIENICTHADEIIFSSTPFDYKEVTHFNVHDPEYWSEQFARHGFYRDLETDLSHITAWAVRFIKTKRTNLKLVQEYERKIWQLKKENFDLRQLSIETQERIKQQEKQIQTLGAQVDEKEGVKQALTLSVQTLNERVAALDAEASNVKDQLRGLQQNRSWRILQKLQQLRLHLAPVGSLREKVFFGNRKK